MIDRSVPKTTAPTTFPGKKSTPRIPAITPSHDQICQRAYELYEMRGRQDGFSEQNWIEAEQELRARK